MIGTDTTVLFLYSFHPIKNVLFMFNFAIFNFFDDFFRIGKVNRRGANDWRTDISTKKVFLLFF